ncbi:I78 family peptidase inhibitor [Sphingomicrobium lutaoense]|uniref:Peptidase inhibitor I78 family protein n=1 Tax=Sphingomicrobium lutaoense TaxID=515949 RepID=A0A839Z1S7_9SPHN|nr:I78 family peptidase inhibitor [Sphingomicrobium lutaoense]MBB3763622.1 hypothetical protein [Sphingomicrobium lutaoense]
MRLTLPLIALAVAGCVPAEPVESTPPERGTGLTCNDEGLSAYIGREATAELGAEMMKAAGAGALRWVPKGAMVTMDYRTDRLNVHLDEKNRITRLNCG